MSLIEQFKFIKYKRTITFDRLANEWLELKKRKVKISTYSNYEYTINNYLMEKLKNCTLGDLEKYNYNKLIDEFDKTLSNKTVRDNIMKLKSILYYANDEYGACVKIKKIEVPVADQEPISILSVKEKELLEEYCLSENSLKSLGVIIGMNTGLRIGELCALRWKNIDLDKREIRIRETLQRIYNENTNGTAVIIDTPKSKRSVRNIPISNKLYSVLISLKKKYSADDFFLTGDPKIIIEPRSYLNMFKEMLKNAGITNDYKFHILRHTFATNCIEAGMDVKSLSEILGHSSVKITMDRYVHSSYKRKIKYLEKL